jgi:hypothetical protein
MFQRLKSVQTVVLLACLALVSCKKDTLPAKGELMLAISTDMQVPKDFDSIHVEVRTYGSVQFSNDYKVGRGFLMLPATLGVVVGKNPSQPVTIRVSSSQAGTVRTLREIVTTVPGDRVATLYVPIQWLCLDQVTTNGAGEVSSSCASGETCVSGSCVTTQVDSTTLPDYQPGTVFGGGDGTGMGDCFDTVACFAGGQDVTVDLSTCTVANVVTKSSGTGVSVAIVLPAGSGGICGPQACLVPLDADSTTGWTLNGDKIQLPKSVCDRLIAGTAKAIAVTTGCASKTASIPTCGDWSSVSTEPGTFDAGTPQDAGSGGTMTLGCYDGSLPACATITATGSPALIDDFNHADSLVPHNDGRRGDWYTFNDGTGTQTPEAYATACTGPVPASHQVCTSGTGFSTWGAGIGLNLNWTTGCSAGLYNAAVYSGVTFTLGGTISSGSLRLDVVTAGPQVPEYGGRCPTTSTCSDFYGKNLTLSGSPQTVRINFSELKQTGWGTPVPWNPAELLSLSWQVSLNSTGSTTGTPVSFSDLCIGNLAFF